MIRGKNIVKEKSLTFAIRDVNLFRFMVNDKKEYILSKQLLKSGTSIGAMIREADHAESKADFIHKMAIAQKECNETLYWLELLNKTDYISDEQFNSMNTDAVELIRLITSIIKKTKKNINH